MLHVFPTSQISRTWNSPEFLQQHVVTTARPAPRHLRVLVVDVTKSNRLGRTGLLAGCDHFIGPQRAVVLVGCDMGSFDPLRTISALLHDAAGAHADVRILHRLLHS